jgi:hypothetical protein
LRDYKTGGVVLRADRRRSQPLLIFVTAKRLCKLDQSRTRTRPVPVEFVFARSRSAADGDKFHFDVIPKQNYLLSAASPSRT